MHNYDGDLIELPKKGKALIITDLHGNLSDFNKLMDIWENFDGEIDNHLVITGDFIHAMGRADDNSVELMEEVKYRFDNDKNFHVLLGNHEWSVISKMTIYKSGADLNFNFEELLKERFSSRWEQKLNEYIEFFKKLPLAVKTKNKVFISHAGPPKNLKNIEKIINISKNGFVNNSLLFELLWNRSGDYDKKDLETFLKTVGCNAMIVGHTPVKGVKIVYKNQLIVSSSFSAGKKAYVELNLEKEIKNAKDIQKMVKFYK